jgi:hypothetical protein
MSELALFKGGVPAHLSALADDDTTNTLAGGDLGQRRISIKGGVFREMIGSKEYRTSEERSMGVVIIKAAPSVHRTYFEGSYVEGQNASPTCWSSNSQTPDASVPEDQRQASKCMDCPQNVKGSGQGDSRACRYQQRIAVLLEGEVEKREVYQVILPATSVFGDGEKSKLPLQAYAKHLKAHRTPIAGVVTEMRFDTASPTPKLVFRPVRPITEDELEVVREMRDSVEAEEAVKLSVSPTKPKEALFAEPEKPKEAKPAKPSKPAPAAEVEEVEAPPPKKVASKKPEATGSNLDDLVAGWDDE